MSDNTVDPSRHETFNPQAPSAEPIEPGAGAGTPLKAPSRQTDQSRAGLVLFLGMLSLFMCGPVGLIAWIIANSELRRIREGTLSPRHSSTLKFGRALGIIGILVFVAGIVCGAVLLQRGWHTFEGLTKAQPLKANQIVYAGEWTGNHGTYIAIRPNGSGDFRSRHSTVTGGKVAIEKDVLSIGLMGLSKKWHIDSPPHMEDGEWSMKLDGEVFRRKSTGLTV